MNIETYTQEQRDFLEQRKAGIDLKKSEGPWPRSVQLINQGQGSFTGCLRTLNIHHSDTADYAWFHDGNLEEFKRHCYVVSKLTYILSTVPEHDSFKVENDHYYALLSDHEPSIQWISDPTLESAYMKGRVANPNMPEYRSYQMTLAVRADFEFLGQRAEVFLANVPVKHKKFAPDMRFYLALAQGDKAGMQNALAEIVDPKVLKKRNEGNMMFFAAHFVSPFASLYTKIARRHGYELEIDTPMIPKQWLPVEPLAQYPDPYAFMEKYTIGGLAPTATPSNKP